MVETKLRDGKPSGQSVIQSCVYKCETKVSAMSFDQREDMKKRSEKGLHPRNLHNSRYDFAALVKSTPELKDFVSENPYGDLSIDFSNPEAVVMLNRALLACFYAIDYWRIPEGYLCPPIPGRVDYIHYMADLLSRSFSGVVPVGSQVRGLDIGVGANCIYPAVASAIYGWRFVGSDIDAVSVRSAKEIVTRNVSLQDKIEIRKQEKPEYIFKEIITKTDRFDFTLCNPPFHRSPQEARKGTRRKNRNLHQDCAKKDALNFGGQSNELWCEGGEVAFVRKMINESKVQAKKVFWFSTLVSKKESLSAIYKALKGVGALEVETIEMQQGQKVTRIVCWTFLSKVQQKEWAQRRWSR